MNRIYLKARAKINLTLNVLEKRPDNYHNIESVFQKISLYDELFIKKNDNDCLYLECNLKELENQSNILNKTFNALKKEFPKISGVNVKLVKHIPLQAGLGGGSTDCASFILGMNSLFNLNASEEKLVEIGKSLGADVVPCMYNLVKSEGIGDIVTKLKSNLTYYILLMKPNYECNTRIMYEKLDSNPNLVQKYNTNDVINILKNGNITDLQGKLYNVFENVIEEKDELNKIKNDFLFSGAIDTLLSGSGSCIYGIYETKKDANKAFDYLKSKYNCKIYKCISCN